MNVLTFGRDMVRTSRSSQAKAHRSDREHVALTLDVDVFPAVVRGLDKQQGYVGNPSITPLLLSYTDHTALQLWRVRIEAN